MPRFSAARPRSGPVGGRRRLQTCAAGAHNLAVETGENGVKMNENERDFAQN
jgi:hypothetical protein